MAGKRARESSSEDGGHSKSIAKVSKRPREDSGNSSSMTVEYQLAGSSKSYTRTLDPATTLDKLIVKVARHLNIPLYGSAIRFTHMTKDGREAEIYDEYDLQACCRRVMDSGSSQAVIRVHSASGSIAPSYSPSAGRSSLPRNDTPQIVSALISESSEGAVSRELQPQKRQRKSAASFIRVEPKELPISHTPSPVITAGQKSLFAASVDRPPPLSIPKTHTPGSEKKRSRKKGPSTPNLEKFNPSANTLSGQKEAGSPHARFKPVKPSLLSLAPTDPVVSIIPTSAETARKPRKSKGVGKDMEVSESANRQTDVVDAVEMEGSAPNEERIASLAKPVAAKKSGKKKKVDPSLETDEGGVDEGHISTTGSLPTASGSDSREKTFTEEKSPQIARHRSSGSASEVSSKLPQGAIPPQPPKQAGKEKAKRKDKKSEGAHSVSNGGMNSVVEANSIISPPIPATTEDITPTEKQAPTAAPSPDTGEHHEVHHQEVEGETELSSPDIAMDDQSRKNPVVLPLPIDPMPLAGKAKRISLSLFSPNNLLTNYTKADFEEPEHSSSWFRLSSDDDQSPRKLSRPDSGSEGRDYLAEKQSKRARKEATSGSEKKKLRTKKTVDTDDAASPEATLSGAEQPPASAVPVSPKTKRARKSKVDPSASESVNSVPAAAPDQDVEESVPAATKKRSAPKAKSKGQQSKEPELVPITHLSVSPVEAAFAEIPEGQQPAETSTGSVTNAVVKRPKKRPESKFKAKTATDTLDVTASTEEPFAGEEDDPAAAVGNVEAGELPGAVEPATAQKKKPGPKSWTKKVIEELDPLPTSASEDVAPTEPVLEAQAMEKAKRGPKAKAGVLEPRASASTSPLVTSEPLHAVQAETGDEAPLVIRKPARKRNTLTSAVSVPDRPQDGVHDSMDAPQVAAADIVEPSSSPGARASKDMQSDPISTAGVPFSEIVLKSRQGQAQHIRQQHRASCIICGQSPTHLQKACPRVKAGVESLHELLKERESEAAPREGSIEAIETWIRRLTSVQNKVNGTITASQETATLNAATASIAPAKIASVASSDETMIPPNAVSGDRPSAIAIPQSATFSPPPVETPSSLPPIFQRALAKAGRTGSHSGLSVSDAVIETGSSASESDDEDDASSSASSMSGSASSVEEDISSSSSESGSSEQSESESDDESVSDSGSTVSVPGGDLLKHFLSQPLTAKQQKKARESAASMTAIQIAADSDAASGEEPIESDADEKDDRQAQQQKQPSIDSSIGDFEAEANTNSPTGTHSAHSDIVPVTQPPEIGSATGEGSQSKETIIPDSTAPVPPEDEPVNSGNEETDRPRRSSRTFGTLAAALGSTPAPENDLGHVALQEVIDEDNHHIDILASQPSVSHLDVLQPTQLARTAHGLPSPPSSIPDPVDKDQPSQPVRRTTRSTSQISSASLAPPVDILQAGSQRRSTRSVSRDATASPFRTTRAMSRDRAQPASPTMKPISAPSTPKRIRGRPPASEPINEEEEKEMTPQANHAPPDAPLSRVRSSQVNELESSQPTEQPETPKQKGRLRSMRTKSASLSPLFFTQSQPPSTQVYNHIPPQTQGVEQSNGHANPKSRSRSSARLTSPIIEEDEEVTSPAPPAVAASESDSAEVSAEMAFASASEHTPRPLDHTASVAIPAPNGAGSRSASGSDEEDEEDEPPIVTIRSSRSLPKAASSQPIISIPSLSSLSKEHLRGRNAKAANVTMSQPLPKLVADSESSSDDGSSSSEDEAPKVSEALKSRFANGSLRSRKGAKRTKGQLKGW